jgi:hypothetical protein
MRHSFQLGNATVEFALVLVMMLALLSGMIDFGRIFGYQDTLLKASREATRILTQCPPEILGSVCVPRTRSLIVAVANADNISPALTENDVTVACLKGNGLGEGQDHPCTDGDQPDSIRVAIDAIWIGDKLLPLVATLVGKKNKTLRLETTLRYMGA